MGLGKALMRTLAAGAVFASGLAWVGPAGALEQDEWLAGGQIGGALVEGPWGVDPGAGLLVELQRGLTDVWALRGSVGIDAWSGSGESWREDLSLGAGAAAAFDVLRIVPFVELGLVFALTDLGAAGDVAGARLGLQGGLGADYLLDRDWSAGLILRGRVLPVAFAGPAVGAGASLGASLRLARRF